MKIPAKFSPKRGFTLMELMVAMAITTIIVTVLVSITAIAMDTWNRSRSELRAARQAKAMVDTMARDFESMVIRKGNAYEWLSAVSPTTLPGDKLLSSNAAELIFFTAATDRYNGDIGVTGKDLGGDVSCVAYRLNYHDPIEQTGTTYKTFALNRYLVDPDVTFTNLLGKPSLTTAFTSYSTNLDKVENFVCENIYQFTLTFHIEASKAAVAPATTSTIIPVQVVIGSTASGVSPSLKINGSGIISSVSPSSVTADELKAGRVTAIEVSLTVLSDAGVEQLRNRFKTATPTTDQKTELLKKHSFQYSKLVSIPSM